MTTHELDAELSTMECGACGGHWIKGFQYWKWLDRHGPNLPVRAAGQTTAALRAIQLRTVSGPADPVK